MVTWRNKHCVGTGRPKNVIVIVVQVTIFNGKQEGKVNKGYVIRNMDTRGDFPAANTRNQCTSATVQQDNVGECGKVPEFSTPTCKEPKTLKTPKTVKTKKKSGGPWKKLIKDDKTPAIDSFLATTSDVKIGKVGCGDQCTEAKHTDLCARQRSKSGKVYSTNISITLPNNSPRGHGWTTPAKAKQCLSNVSSPFSVDDLPSCDQLGITPLTPANHGFIMADSVKRSVSLIKDSQVQLNATAHGTKASHPFQGDNQNRIKGSEATIESMVVPTVTTTTMSYATASMASASYINKQQQQTVLTTASSTQNAVFSSVLTPAETPAMGSQMMDQFHRSAVLYDGQSKFAQPPGGTMQDAPLAMSYAHSYDPPRYQQPMILDTNDITSRMEGLEYEQDEDHETVMQLKNKVNVLTHKVGMLGDIVSKYEQQFQVINKTLHRMNTKHMKLEIRITNLIQGEEESLKVACTNLLQNKLGIANPGIVDVYRKGDEKGPVIVRLATFENKKLIFDNVKKLKGVKNAEGKSYGISTHHTEEENEVDI